MPNINKETIRTLSKLCRIQCSEEEQAKLLENLQSILNYMEQLHEINTDHVEPLNHVLTDVVNVEREDVVGETLPRELFLKNAPDQIGGMIRTPPVIKK